MVSVAQVSAVESDFAGLGNAANGTLSVAVSDIGSNLSSAALATLGADARVASIGVSSGALSLTESQFVSGVTLAGMAKITGGWSVDVTSASVAQVDSIESAFSGLGNAGNGALSIAIRDGAGNLTSAALATLGADPDGVVDHGLRRDVVADRDAIRRRGRLGWPRQDCRRPGASA